MVTVVEYSAPATPNDPATGTSTYGARQGGTTSSSASNAASFTHSEFMRLGMLRTRIVRGSTPKAPFGAFAARMRCMTDMYSAVRTHTRSQSPAATRHHPSAFHDATNGPKRRDSFAQATDASMVPWL